MLKNFIKDDSGAVTVDWVVLTAAIVGIAIAVLIVIASGINTASNNVSGSLNSADSVASLITTDTGGSGSSSFIGSLGDYSLTWDEGSHQHYVDSGGNDFYLENGTFYEGINASGTVIGSVDGDGNISPPPAG